MLPHDRAMALSAVETEQLRDLRSRLNRIAASPATAAKSVGPLSKGFFELCTRVGLAGGAPAAGDDSGKGLAKRADHASAAGLKTLIAGLEQRHRGDPRQWSEILAAGVLQAVISRRLALAGREPPKEGVQS